MVHRNINSLAFSAATLTVGFLLMSAPVSDVHAQGASALEEIVVTARRREENIQDVPIAITALSAEDIELRNIENTEDMQVLLPNVDIRGGGVTGTNASTLTIRGIPGVVRYVDGVAQTGDQGGLMNIVELERIEVLRGPQGTLFGKNAVGGAIQYITQKPGEEFGARVKLRGRWCTRPQPFWPRLDTQHPPRKCFCNGPRLPHAYPAVRKRPREDI